MGVIIKIGIAAIGVITATLIGFVLTVGSCSSDLILKALAAETQEVVDMVKTASSDTFEEIQGNIDMVYSLKEQVQQAQIAGETISLDDVIGNIETITESYESLASRRDDIRKELLSKVGDIESMRKAVDAEISDLWQKRTDYWEQLQAVNDTDQDINRTRKEALNRAIGYVDQQIVLWTEFGKIEGDIVIEMSGIQSRIDSFLAMIESTSIVFREGLNLLTLQRDINEAVALFSNDIPRMEQLTQDMEKSWDNLDYLLNTLTGVAQIGP